MAGTSVLGLEVDDIAPAELLGQLTAALNDSQSHWLATVNNEGLLLAQRDAGFMATLRQADWRTCDAVGLQWAAHYQRLNWPRWLKVALMPFSLVRLLLQPASAGRTLHNRYPGRQLFVDLLERCAAGGQSVYFLGGAPGVAAQTATKARKLYPRLQVAGYFEGDPRQPETILQNIKPSSVLFVAFGQPKQELFIAGHLDRLQTRLAIGVGGTFDYFIGAKPTGSRFRQLQPPGWLSRLGLEWAWRLATQPNRFVRIMRAVWVFAYKVAVAPVAR